jgi:polyisoprenoid-binding protein YceI
MDTLKIHFKNWFLLLMVIAPIYTVFGQDSKVVLAESKLVVDGTSNLHDWTIEAKAMSGKASVTLEAGDLKALKNLDFSVEVEQLKSGKSGMDKNTFKALKSTSNKNISFKLVKVVKMTTVSDNNYTIETQGDLTIAGATKRINQTFMVKLIGKKMVFTGKQKIDMTVYGVEPPKALMGTIKTGKDVTVDFKVTYN